MVRHDGTGRAEIEERERAATRAADAHYIQLHISTHDSKVPYRECPRCKDRGWR